MAWEDVPAKLAKYRAMEYGGDKEADRLIKSFFILSDEDIDMIPVEHRADFEAQLDYRIGACENLASSVGWSKEKLRQA